MIGTNLTLWSVVRTHGSEILVRTAALVVAVLVLAQLVGGLATTSGIPELEAVAALTATIKFTLLLAVPVILFVTVRQVRADMAADYYRKLSGTDPLTGLFNRRAFGELIADGLHGAQKNPSNGAILMIDVDHFKRVNDRYGHEAGDAVLVQLADLFRRNLRRDDIAGRLGGEEFAVALNRGNQRDVWHVAQRLRHAVEQHPFRHDDEVIRVTVSVGVAMIGVDGDSSAALLEADQLAYRSKREGRNRISYGGWHEEQPLAA